MRLLGLVEHPDHVCARYRLEAVAPLLERHGHRLELRALPRGLLGRVALWRQAAAYDAVILQRRLLPAWHLLLLRRFARRLVFDFDDAVFLRDSYSGKPLSSGSRRRRFAALMRVCDAVAAGNAFLAQHAARSGTAARVHLIPTCLDPSRYALAPHREDAETITLVWIGSSSTLQGLQRTRELWEELGRRLPRLRLKLICDRFFRLERLPVLPCPWSQPTEAQELAAADIGISWLPDDDWSRGKCGLKVLQYFAAGLPVVANPVGMHTTLVQPGRTGYLAETPQEWCQAVARLAADPGLRRRLGHNARCLVEQHYSLPVAGQQWVRLLDDLAERSAA